MTLLFQLRLRLMWAGKATQSELHIKGNGCTARIGVFYLHLRHPGIPHYCSYATDQRYRRAHLSASASSQPVYFTSTTVCPQTASRKWLHQALHDPPCDTRARTRARSHFRTMRTPHHNPAATTRPSNAIGGAGERASYAYPFPFRQSVMFCSHYAPPTSCKQDSSHSLQHPRKNTPAPPPPAFRAPTAYHAAPTELFLVRCTC